MKHLIIITFLPLLCGCDGYSKQKDRQWADDNSDYSTYAESTEEEMLDKDNNSIKIAYTKQSSNTTMIPLKINAMSLDMIFDTGASNTCITLAESQYLYEKGKLTDDDIVDLHQFKTADGSISVGLRVILRELVIGDKIKLEDVEAVVVQNQQAPLLLGQSEMKQFRKISVDRENKVVKFFE